MKREAHLARICERRGPWDMLVIGGGATGLGVAVDAASRGYEVALLEQSDIAKGTSSRSTKLIHGGLRYLRQGRVALVRQSLRERAILRHNAPHLVEPLAFVVPCQSWRERVTYTTGLMAYDLLAVGSGFPRSRWMRRDAVRAALPGLQDARLTGGIVYHDAQFDDARLAISLAQTAADHGAALVNYVRVTGFCKNARGAITGVTAVDVETKQALEIAARIVINAAGPFVDRVRALDDAASNPMLSLSQGAHVVLDRSLLGGDTALIVPRTPDGRVLFAIPWQDVLVVGTTDTPLAQEELEPAPRAGEITFILETVSRYLSQPVTRRDVLSVFAGIRPLVSTRRQKDTAAVSREHHVRVDPRSGLLTVAGGKWTTYRWMAEQVVHTAAGCAGLPKRPCVTRDLPLSRCGRVGDLERAPAASATDAASIENRAAWDAACDQPIHPSVPITPSQIAWYCHHEMARTVEDILARRTRYLLFNARAAADAAPAVAAVLARELTRDAQWTQAQILGFQQLASQYTITD